MNVCASGGTLTHMDVIRRHHTPLLRKPIAIIAFCGWNDACDVASTAAEFIVDANTDTEVFAELEPDPLVPVGSLCNRCRACAAACPGQCLSRDDEVEVTLAGVPVRWGRLEEWKCFAYYQGAAAQSNPFLRQDAFAELPQAKDSRYMPPILPR